HLLPLLCDPVCCRLCSEKATVTEVSPPPSQHNCPQTTVGDFTSGFFICILKSLLKLNEYNRNI
ncbi:hypothetical protein STEG23_005586, partial [Scotinomys teguina]